ncbi:sensor histidine kinase [Leptolyngbya sp. PCC 6406]|uniref:sensor histidine kinase n=1 Tax=Leptolyngbya sp. PCC 6406 TaxID=1173264 RepID=UPI0002ABC7D6|nr:PAS domain-containing sensor histidine kinase [Leptolyngbya sp. PCC 6406]
MAIVHAYDLGLLGLGMTVGGGLGWWLRSRFQARLYRAAPRPNLVARNVSTDAEQMELELRSLLHQAPIGYLQVDEENQLMWCNGAARRLLGITYGNQEPTNTPRLLLEWVRSYELDQLIEQSRLTQTPHEQDWVLNLVSPDPLHPNEGVAYPLRGYSIPLGNGQVGVFLENRQEAVTLMQQRDRWTSDVAHELKTPLTSIRLVAETLRNRVDSSLQSWFDRLLNEILRLSNLVEDLLNLSRLESSGGLGLAPKSTDLPQLIFSAWRSLEPLAQIKQLDIEYDGPPELLVTLDEGLIHRVLINLLDNAIKYSPQGGMILVRTVLPEATADMRTSGSATVQIDVIDQGEGFKETDLPYIFSRFYRADPARARFPATVLGAGLAGTSTGGSSSSGDGTGRGGNNSGTGLGLAIVQQIVDAHSGYVTARNHPETGGGWLTLNLPVTATLPLIPHL